MPDSQIKSCENCRHLPKEKYTDANCVECLDFSQWEISIKDRIKEIIEDKFSLDFRYLDDYGNLYDHFGFDSLDAVELLMCVEHEYDIKINDDEGASWQTIDDIVKTCENNIEAKNK